MAMLGRSVYLNTLFSLGKLGLVVDHYFMHILSPELTTTLHESKSAEGRRMVIEISSWLISAKVWDQARVLSVLGVGVLYMLGGGGCWDGQFT